MNEDRYRTAEDALWASFGLRPVEHLVPFGADRTSLRVLEVGAGAPVVFIHGASASGANWAPLVGRLDGHRCLILDRPGCGLSGPLPHRLDTAGFHRFADGFVGAVLDAVELDRADIVATSFGGQLAVRSAAAQPERIGRLVELGYCFGAPLQLVPLSMRIATTPGLGRLMARLPANRPAVRAILRQLGMGEALENGAIDDVFVDWFVALLRHTDTIRNELATNPDLIHWRRGLNPDVGLGPDLVGRVPTPTLFVWGDRDPIGGADVARSFVAGFPAARLELLDTTSHAPWVDQPERCAALITEFLTT